MRRAPSTPPAPAPSPWGDAAALGGAVALLGVALVLVVRHVAKPEGFPFLPVTLILLAILPLVGVLEWSLRRGLRRRAAAYARLGFRVHGPRTPHLLATRQAALLGAHQGRAVKITTRRSGRHASTAYRLRLHGATPRLALTPAGFWGRLRLTEGRPEDLAAIDATWRAMARGRSVLALRLGDGWLQLDLAGRLPRPQRAQAVLEGAHRLAEAWEGHFHGRNRVSPA